MGTAVSTSRDLADARVTPGVPPSPNGWNRWTVDGLDEGTPYFWQLVDTPAGGDPQLVGPVASFATLHEVGVPCTIRRAVGSCMTTKGGALAFDTSVFEDILAWVPDRVTHLGDLGYPIGLTRKTENHVAAITRQLVMPGLTDVLAMGAVDYIHSDHDTNAGNNLPNFKDPVTKACIRGWLEMVPFRLTDVRVPAHGVWRSEVEGRVRFVKLDYRSIDRTNSIGRSPADPTSRRLGSTQLGWLFAELASAADAGELVVLLTDSSWNEVCPDPVDLSHSDKMPAYQYERDLISDHAIELGVELVIVHGDTHLLLHDESHEKNGFVVVGCSPFVQVAEGHFQESYDWCYPTGQPETGGRLRVQQYQRLTWDDDGTTTTFTAEARSCSVDGGRDSPHAHPPVRADRRGRHVRHCANTANARVMALRS